MKILLAITVCEQHKERIVNQLANLQKHSESLKLYNICPLFVYGDQPISVDVSPYDSLQLDVEERYTNLYKKVFGLFEKSLARDFDYLIKIDDDTLFNINLLGSLELTADYIGRFLPKFTENAIHIHIPMFNVYSAIQFYPKIFTDQFKFATGDLYILSRRVVEFLANIKESLFNSLTEQEYICEDQLVGYCLKDQTQEFKCEDITFSLEEPHYQIFQFTKHLMSLHPIHNEDYLCLVERDPENQLRYLLNTNTKDSANFYRKGLLLKLKNDLEKVIFDFVNHKKMMGMG